jgi:pimeloyl-ACP methyl ester carboxylesterase
MRVMDIALVHGNFHGAWCWDLVRPELEGRGHRVYAIDLPITDPAAGAAEYANVIEDVLPPDCEPVIVGHSMGGLIIPLVATRRAVRRLIFLAALLPKPGISANDQRGLEPIDALEPPSAVEWVDMGDNVWAIGPNTATELFFYDVPSDVTRWALDRLRPQSYRILGEVTPLDAWPDVPASSIVCRGDRSINPAWVRTAARERLGTEAVEIEGGHSPFLSRPAELAALIDSLL